MPGQHTIVRQNAGPFLANEWTWAYSAPMAAVHAGESHSHPIQVEARMEACLDALRELDVQALEAAVGRALISFGPLSPATGSSSPS
jgi:hypothetical protein